MWKCVILRDLKTVVLKYIYQYLFKIILAIVNLKYGFLPLYPRNLNKMLVFHKVAFFPLLCLYLKTTALQTSYMLMTLSSAFDLNSLHSRKETVPLNGHILMALNFKDKNVYYISAIKENYILIPLSF